MRELEPRHRRRVPGDGGHARRTSRAGMLLPADRGARRGRRGRARSRATRARSWCAGCSSTRSTRTRRSSSARARSARPRRLRPRVHADGVPHRRGGVGPGRRSASYKLIEALDRVLKALEPKVQHEVVRERLSLSAAIQRHRRAAARPASRMTFLELFEGRRTRAAGGHHLPGAAGDGEAAADSRLQDERQKDIFLTAKADALESWDPGGRRQ